MDLGLQGKRAWVLGGSKGLGRAVAEGLSAEGARVAISSRSGRGLETTAAEVNALPVPLDIAQGAGLIAQACAQVAEGLGGLDIVVVNHGGPMPGGFDAIDESAFGEAFDLVLGSAFRVTKAAVPYLRQAGGGVIAYVTSTATKEIMPNLFLSNTMRAGVVGMMKTFSYQLAGDGIRLLCVAPGRISTDRSRSIDTAAAQREGTTETDVRRRSEQAIPLGRYGQPREFGDVVAFLCSARASYVTGCSVVVDGGALKGLLS
jgi:3-oxoacyl-[acyl-carrier protein] reductase